jgi:hypothetical protein
MVTFGDEKMYVYSFGAAKYTINKTKPARLNYRKKSINNK